MADHNFACQVSAPAAESVSTSQAHPSMPTQITNSNTTYNHCSNISHGTVHYHVSPTETNGGPSTINNGVNEDENEGDDAEEDDKVVPQFDLATNMLLIPFELIPKDEKDINAHADRYFNFWRHLDSRQIRDRVVHAKTQDALKDFAKKIRSIHKQASYIGASEYARVACEDLNQEVEGLIHDGKIKAIERLVQLPHFFASVRKHSPRDKPMVGLDISYRVLHHLNWEDSRFNREELPQKINEWGKEHDPPFQLLQVQPKVKNGRKRRMTNHPLVQIANEKARHNKKLIQRAETSAFGMSIRVRQPSKPPEGHTIIEYTPNVFLAVKNQVFPSIGASSTLNDLIKVMQSQKQLTGPLPQEKQEQPSWQEQPSFTEIIQKLAMQNDRNALIRAIDRAYMNMGRQSQDEIGPMIQTPNRHVEDSSSARQSQYEIGPMVQTPNRNVEDSSSSPAVSSYGGISLPDGFEDVVDDCVNTISRDDDEDKQASTGAPDFYSALNRHGIPIGVPIRHDDEEEVSKESDMDDFNNAFLCDKTEKNERDSKKERDSVSKEKSRQAFASDIKDARDCGHKTSGSAWDVVDIYSRRKKKRNVEVFIEYAESFNGEWKKERFSWQPVSNLSAADREKFESEYIPLKNKETRVIKRFDDLHDFGYADPRWLVESKTGVEWWTDEKKQEFDRSSGQCDVGTIKRKINENKVENQGKQKKPKITMFRFYACKFARLPKESRCRAVLCATCHDLMSCGGTEKSGGRRTSSRNTKKDQSDDDEATHTKDANGCCHTNLDTFQQDTNPIYFEESYREKPENKFKLLSESCIRCGNRIKVC